MWSRYFLFAAAAGATLVGLNILLKPRLFRAMMTGLGVGVATSWLLTAVNQYRQHSIRATYVPLGLTKPPNNFAAMKEQLYSHLAEDYIDRGELDLGEEEDTVAPHVFAQIGVVDVDGVRRMWAKTIQPLLHLSSSAADGQTVLHKSGAPLSTLEEGVIFCDIGSGVGNVCLQVLAETGCRKTVGVDVISSRVRAAEAASAKANVLYPETFDSKEAIWVNKNFVDCAPDLRAHEVNVLFTHSWMFDAAAMHELTRVIAQVPRLFCVITSRRLDDRLLKQSGSALHVSHEITLSADWNESAPFYVYTT